MKRASKASIAALAFVPALGFAMAPPAGADNEVVVNAGGNNCGVLVDADDNRFGDNENLGFCYYLAAPDRDSYIYALTSSGPGPTKSELYCNDPLFLDPPVALVTDTAADGFTKFGPFDNPGGVCVLKVTVSDGTKGSGWVSWLPTP